MTQPSRNDRENRLSSKYGLPIVQTAYLLLRVIVTIANLDSCSCSSPAHESHPQLIIKNRHVQTPHIETSMARNGTRLNRLVKAGLPQIMIQSRSQSRTTERTHHRRTEVRIPRCLASSDDLLSRGIPIIQTGYLLLRLIVPIANRDYRGCSRLVSDATRLGRKNTSSLN